MTYDSFGKLTASSGSLVNSFQYTARESDSETGLYYYRARYYDPSVGRFINEDPVKFGGGGNFYRFVDNKPTGLSDPYGLSPADVQRIKDKCKRCTQSITDAGHRLAGSGWPSAVKNDQIRNWNWLTGKNLFGCKEQAAQIPNCLDDKGYDSHWTFSEWGWWLGFHTIVRARSDDPNDPIVFCNPWRDISWTALPSQPGVGEPIDIRTPMVN
jgi:RHS repeat-associated protein